MQKQVRETRPFQVLLGSFFALEYTMSYLRNTPRPGDLTGSLKMNLTVFFKEGTRDFPLWKYSISHVPDPEPPKKTAQTFKWKSMFVYEVWFSPSVGKGGIKKKNLNVTCGRCARRAPQG